MTVTHSVWWQCGCQLYAYLYIVCVFYVCVYTVRVDVCMHVHGVIGEYMCKRCVGIVCVHVHSMYIYMCVCTCVWTQCEHFCLVLPIYMCYTQYRCVWTHCDHFCLVLPCCQCEGRDPQSGRPYGCVCHCSPLSKASDMIKRLAYNGIQTCEHLHW